MRGMDMKQGWHEWRDDLFRRVVDALTECYVRQAEDARAMGHETSQRYLSCEIVDGKGMVAVEWKSGEEARADAWGKDEYLPLLSLWLSNALSRYGMYRVEEEALRRMEESDRMGDALRDTEESLLYSNMWF